MLIHLYDQFTNVLFHLIANLFIYTAGKTRTRGNTLTCNWRLVYPYKAQWLLHTYVWPGWTVKALRFAHRRHIYRGISRASYSKWQLIT